MALMLAGLLTFFAIHLALAAPAAAEGMQARVGAMGRKGLVTVASFAGLALIVVGWAGAGGAGVLWTPPAWTRHVALALMLPSLIFVVAAYLPAGRIKAAVKHPMILGVKVWAFAHLVANGEVRSVLLFGTFLAYAVFVRIALKRRGDAGAANAETRLVWDLAAVAIGAAAYGLIAYQLHPILFGVAVVG